MTDDSNYKWIDASAYGMRFYMARVHGRDDVVTFVVMEDIRTIAAREDAFALLKKIGYRPLDCFDVAWRRGSDLPAAQLKAQFPNIVDVAVKREDFARSIHDGKEASNIARCLHDAIVFRPKPRTPIEAPAPPVSAPPPPSRPQAQVSAESEAAVMAAMGM